MVTGKSLSLPKPASTTHCSSVFFIHSAGCWTVTQFNHWVKDQLWNSPSAHFKGQIRFTYYNQECVSVPFGNCGEKCGGEDSDVNYPLNKKKKKKTHRRDIHMKLLNAEWDNFPFQSRDWFWPTAVLQNHKWGSFLDFWFFSGSTRDWIWDLLPRRHVPIPNIALFYTSNA